MSTGRAESTRDHTVLACRRHPRHLGGERAADRSTLDAGPRRCAVRARSATDLEHNARVP